jgi:OOP family OmpA-OmpF porin
MKKLNYLLTAAAGVALSACSFIHVSEVNDMRTVTAQGGTPFTQALAKEYRARTVNEADNEYEWDDAAWYARKGMTAAKGEAVMPVDVAAAPEGAHLRYGDLGPVVQIPAERVADLSTARGRLVAFLDGGGRDHQPALAARAQAFYDCWVEEEWEKDEANIPMCRKEFMGLEGQFKIAQAQPVPSAVVAPMQNTFQVFFDFDRSNIGEDAAKILRQAATSAKHGTITHLKLIGHTDSSGSDAYNQGLSERRAEAVKAELAKDDVQIGEISTEGVGKAGQLVPTADGVREPQNRRTEIDLQ